MQAYVHRFSAIRKHLQEQIQNKKQRKQQQKYNITTMLTLKRTHLHKTHLKQIHSLVFSLTKAIQRFNATK